MKKLIQLITISLLLISSFNTSALAKTEVLKNDHQYRVVDVNNEGEIKLIETYKTYDDALNTYQQNIDKYDNLSIAYGTTYLQCEYGIVAFKSNNTCTINTNYTNAENGEAGYTNGCYGSDGSFINYNHDTKQVSFELSAVTGLVNIDDVDIYPISLVPNVSMYQVKNRIIYHYIKGNATSNSYTNIIALSLAPSCLEEKVNYYSYDGHYFYASYEKMIDDVRNNTNEHAINHDEPYYNYYQYISHRSLTNYSFEEFESYLTDKKGFKTTITDFIDNDYNQIHDNLSQSLIMQGSNAFYQYQNQYGANAIMMLALACNESSNGRSILAYERNNLFGHAAFDEDVDSASGYHLVSDSIYAHAKHYISKSYSNPSAYQYHGSHFGNKNGGMNVQYASDPYWGEKAAQYYFQFDQDKQKDYQAYAIAISDNGANLYAKGSKNAQVIQKLVKGEEHAFIIKQKSGDFYQIQYEQANLDGSYSFADSIAYLHKDDIKYIINKDQISNKKYYKIKFDANGGLYPNDQPFVTMEVLENQIPQVIAPSLAHNFFIGYQEDINKANEDKTYYANYLLIEKIELKNKPQTTYTLNESLKLNNASLLITLSDNSAHEIMLTTDMITNFSSEKVGSYDLKIEYANEIIDLPIEIVESKNNEATSLIKQASEMIANYSEVSLTNKIINEFQTYKTNLNKLDENPLSIDVIRALDRIAMNTLKTRFSTIISDSTYDLQVSGLALAIDDTPQWFHDYMPKTIKINLTNNQDKKPYATICEANGLRLDDVIKIDGSVDFDDYNPNLEVVYSLKKPKDSSDRLYQILVIDENGDIIQIPTYQSENRILFKGVKGQYALCSIEVKGLEGGFDFTEVNFIGHNGKDYIFERLYVPAIAIGFVASCIIIIIIVCITRKIRKRG